jgi:hypothetical protein
MVPTLVVSFCSNRTPITLTPFYLGMFLRGGNDVEVFDAPYFNKDDDRSRAFKGSRSEICFQTDLFVKNIFKKDQIVYFTPNMPTLFYFQWIVESFNKGLLA